MRQWLFLFLSLIVLSPRVNAGPEMPYLAFLTEKGPVVVRLDIRLHGKPFRAGAEMAQKTYLRELFTFLDRNDNGGLEAMEAKRLPPPMLAVPGIQGSDLQFIHLAHNFRALDSNNNDQVSLEELTGFYRYFNNGLVVSQRARALTANRSAVDAAWFRALDSNKDGKLSQRELNQATQRFSELDADENDLLSAQEVSPSVAIGGGAQLVAQPPPVPSSPVTELRIVSDSVTEQDLAREIVEHYRNDRVAEVGPKEIGLSPQQFAQLDADKNQWLNQQELARVGTLPGIQLTFHLGERAKETPLLEARPAPQLQGIHFQQDRQGNLLLQSKDAILEIRCNDNRLGQETLTSLQRLFEGKLQLADKDGNAILDAKEARAAQLFRKLHLRMDQDGDGGVSQAELKLWLTKVQVAEAKALASQVSLFYADREAGFWSLLDRNRDGQLGLREVRNLNALLAPLDRNRDGCLQRSEIPRNYRIVIGMGQGSFHRQATSEIVTLTSEGQLTYLPADASGGPLWFRKMDRNNDGDVSKKEFLGPIKAFKKIDVDQDGLISEEEASSFKP